ncbi:hypothetical protein QAD02_009918 [Eretmocerus hayati]|uniref:Uncharacterized protein n=1 Tax=Eretmocerus hayati TaxID=131215 RepID=A0ACC2NAT2_9HYME|nr:hypothetical protein QAD02_009918 [Eretmocerus hayati]
MILLSPSKKLLLEAKNIDLEPHKLSGNHEKMEAKFNTITTELGHTDSEDVYQAQCYRNGTTRDQTCKISQKFSKFHRSRQVCIEDLKKSVGLYSNRIQLVPLNKKVIMSWIQEISRNERKVMVRLISISNCTSKDISFPEKNPRKLKYPLVKIISYGKYFDVFSRDFEDVPNLQNQSFIKFTYDENGTYISQEKAFFKDIPLEDKMLSGANSFQTPIRHLLPISFQDHDAGYFFITKFGDHIKSLNSNGSVRKTVKLDKMTDPMYVTYGYGRIGIPQCRNGDPVLETYDRNLKKLIIPYKWIKKTPEEKIINNPSRLC